MSTIYFGDKPLIEGPPVGDGEFVVKCSGDELFIRWLRGGFAYETKKLADSEDDWIGHRHDYTGYLLISAWPAAAPAVERGPVKLVELSNGTRAIVFRYPDSASEPHWGSAGIVYGNTLHTTAEVDAMPGTYCDPWAPQATIAELEKTVNSYAGKIGQLRKELDEANGSLHKARLLLNDASPATATEGE